jgi:hypothetical protein
MLHLVAWSSVVPRVFDLRIRAAVCIVSSLDTLAHACAARPRDVVVVPLGLLDAERVLALRTLGGPRLRVFAVARSYDDFMSEPDLSIYDHLVSAYGLEAKLVEKLGCVRELPQLYVPTVVTTG